MKTYRDIQGDGGSNVVAQVEAQQRAIRDALAGVRHRLAIGSGKGGVGKSTVTMALARALRRAGREVAILDGDFNGPCQARLAGLETAPWIPGERGLALLRSDDGIGVLSFGSLLPEARPLEIDSVACGEEQTWRATREFAILGQLLGGVDWGELDFLLFDLPPGAERTRQFAEFLGPETAFVLVTIPSDLSRGVVARSIAALEEGAGRLLGYVENMVGYYCRECGSIRPLFPDAEIKLSIPCLGAIPFDSGLAVLGQSNTDTGNSGGLPSAAEAVVRGAAEAAVREVALRIIRALESES